MKNILFVAIFFAILGCNSIPADPVVGIQPFKGFDKTLTDSVQQTLERVYGFKVVVLPPAELPKSAFVRIKSPRYRADSLLRFLRATKPDTIDYLLGLTHKDISTTKRDKFGNIKKPESKYTDWGVFGLGFRPRPSCVVSTYRIRKTSHKNFILRLQKITMHEVGHNLGLPHCDSGDKCVMKDAAETIKTIDYVALELCSECKSRINSAFLIIP
ncbi:MAG: hypothetical protein AAF740_12575 [Bacteroidota bacterium]